jgi:O-antigen ligase
MAAADRAATIARAARWPAILIGLSVPISIAADNILLALAALGAAVGLADRAARAAVFSNPAVRCALALFALLALGTLYGDRYAGDAGRYLGKYLDLALLPLLLVPFMDERSRRLGLYALAASLLVTLALSFALKLGLVSEGRPFAGKPDNAAVFKNDLTHNFLMAFGAFLFLQLGFAARGARARIAWWICAALAAADVLLLVRGRTGYVVLLALLVYAGHAWKGWRGLAALCVAGALGVTALLLTPNMFSARVERTLNEARQWQENRVRHEESITMRLEWYRNSLAIIAAHPVVGSGTGSFPKAYAERTSGSALKTTVNPHNEYLHIGVQIGLVGLAALLALFAVQWHAAARLATPLETHLARALVIAFAIGCLFNSLLLDHTEGLFFAWLSALLYGGLVPRKAA